MSDNVKAFPGHGELPDNPLQITSSRFDYCSHESVVLDDHTRTLTCSDPKCGAVLDPFDYLRQNAKTLQRAWSNYRQVNAQAHEIADRVSVLKKEEQRLRAMLKRLQEKTGAVISTRGKDIP